jgi:mRNA-degrading endonuclease RelE of RelBE toxin-antitoxin system
MHYTVQIVPGALAELKAIKAAIKAYYQRQIAQAIDEQLARQPGVVTKNRKLLPDVQTSFPCEPPVWELRVGDFRVFYDIDEAARLVAVRAIREKPPHAQTEEVV